MSCSKPVFLRQELPEKAESFFCLISCSLFSILSIWPLTFINQSILIFLPRFPFKSYSLIICCNVLLKVNSISSEILLMFLQYKMFSSQPNSLASVSIICISPKQHSMEACVDEFRFFEASVDITSILFFSSIGTMKWLNTLFVLWCCYFSRFLKIFSYAYLMNIT